MAAIFGPAGTDNGFKQSEYKNRDDIPEYLSKMGLSAFEYQCGRGVNISDDSAEQFGQAAKRHNITLSLHAPYFISLSSIDPAKRDASIGYILASLKAAGMMGAERIVVHSGSCAKITRQQAMTLAKDTLQKAVSAADNEGYSSMRICPETMGKINQLGDLDEVLELCLIDERLIPCVDFGHLNARTQGGIKNESDYAAVFEAIERKLGIDRVKNIHIHFSKIEYTSGGEKKHLTFADTIYGPEFMPLAAIIAKRNLSPVIICESDGTQSKDALWMKEKYEDLL
ncbi:MAG: TIM barrel protein [Oscillospiraceae bacterium]|nr:TIM barrel protein [Oscillospiraceae bacterium]